MPHPSARRDPPDTPESGGTLSTLLAEVAVGGRTAVSRASPRRRRTQTRGGMYKLTRFVRFGYWMLRLTVGPIIRFLWVGSVTGLENIPRSGGLIIASKTGEMTTSDIAEQGSVYSATYIASVTLAIHGALLAVLSDGYAGLGAWARATWQISGRLNHLWAAYLENAAQGVLVVVCG
jgi:hypothetical protein